MSSDEQRRAAETGMTDSRAREILESYGGRSALWPETERAALLERAEGDRALAELQENEEALDRVLAALESPEWSQTLADRILGDFDVQLHRNTRSIRVRVRGLAKELGHAVWPGVPLWRPVAAVGLSILFGLTIGALIPADQPAQETDVTVATSPLDMNASLDSIELI